MSKSYAWVLLGTMFTANLFSGCRPVPGTARLLPVAVRASNEEAARLYHVEPFNEQDGQMRRAGDGFVWEGLTSSGGHDLVARVTFDRAGSIEGVEVQMLVHPELEPSTNLNRQMRPEIQPSPSSIPEVVPK